MKLPTHLSDDQQEVAEYHISQAIAPHELHTRDAVGESGLKASVSIRDLTLSDFDEVTNIMVWGGYGPWEYSEISFAAVIRLRPDAGLPGSWAALTGGCDYTGWGCQSGAYITFGATREEVVTWGLDKFERQELGLPEEGE